MKRNILILICLAFMAGAVFFAISLYSKLDMAEKRNTALLSEKVKLADSIERLNKSLAQRNNVLETSTLEEKIKNADSVNSTEIQNYKTEAVKFIETNNKPAYQQALLLEAQGFDDIINNKFDDALQKFNQIVAISPSFHSAYEITRMLNSRKTRFTDPATQKDIKELVTTKYKWKAPAEKINIIKAQLTRTPNVTNTKADVKPAATLLNTNKGADTQSVAKPPVKPVLVKPQSGTNKLYNKAGGK